MSLKKPIFKVTRECSYCKGSGRKWRKEKYNYYSGKLNRNRNSYIILDCKRCVGLGRIDVKKNDPKFKKYYQKALEQRVADLTTEYRNANSKAYKIGEELRKHCKELDKVVNK